MAYSHKMPGASEMEILKAAMRHALAAYEKQKASSNDPAGLRLCQKRSPWARRRLPRR